MKIWIDVLTPKQLLFIEPIVFRLKKKHKILCTSRHYSEVTNLAKIRKFSLNVVGKHGGGEKFDKLEASLVRMKHLSAMIKKFEPDLAISFCSPEASRITFGMGINHIGFSDSPHATAVMKLSVPLIQKLLVPWIIPKSEFEKFGIDSKNIIQYKSIDAVWLSKRTISNGKLPFPKNGKKTILFRLEEDKAAYSEKKNFSLPLIKELVRKLENETIVVLCRYDSQIKNLRKLFGKKIIILPMSYDGKLLLMNSDVFIGSGGTMTAESAFLGIPTISYNAVPNLVEDYLVKKRLIVRENNPRRIIRTVRKMLIDKPKKKNRVLKVLDKMEDPYQKLVETIQKLG